MFCAVLAHSNITLSLLHPIPTSRSSSFSSILSLTLFHSPLSQAARANYKFFILCTRAHICTVLRRERWNSDCEYEWRCACLALCVCVYHSLMCRLWIYIEVVWSTGMHRTIWNNRTTASTTATSLEGSSNNNNTNINNNRIKTNAIGLCEMFYSCVKLLHFFALVKKIWIYSDNVRVCVNSNVNWIVQSYWFVLLFFFLLRNETLAWNKTSASSSYKLDILLLHHLLVDVWPQSILHAVCLKSWKISRLKVYAIVVDRLCYVMPLTWHEWFTWTQFNYMHSRNYEFNHLKWSYFAICYALDPVNVSFAPQSINWTDIMIRDRVNLKNYFNDSINI